MSFKNDLLSALKDVGRMTTEERNELSKSSRWCTYILIAGALIFTIALFMHPTGGAG